MQQSMLSKLPLVSECLSALSARVPECLRAQVPEYPKCPSDLSGQVLYFADSMQHMEKASINY